VIKVFCSEAMGAEKICKEFCKMQFCQKRDQKDW